MRVQRERPFVSTILCRVFSSSSLANDRRAAEPASGDSPNVLVGLSFFPFCLEQPEGNPPAKSEQPVECRDDQPIRRRLGRKQLVLDVVGAKKLSGNLYVTQQNCNADIEVASAKSGDDDNQQDEDRKSNQQGGKPK